MLPEEIKNKETFINFIKSIDENNLLNYIKIMEYYEKNTIHNIYKISSYIFSRIYKKINDIDNIYNYFVVSMQKNIEKLNKNNILKEKNNLSIPSWFNKEIPDNKATKEEIQEMKELLKDFMD